MSAINGEYVTIRTIEKTALRKSLHPLRCGSKSVIRISATVNAAIVPKNRTVFALVCLWELKRKTGSPGVVLAQIYKAKPSAPRMSANSVQNIDIALCPDAKSA